MKRYAKLLILISLVFTCLISAILLCSCEKAPYLEVIVDEDARIEISDDILDIQKYLTVIWHYNKDTHELREGVYNLSCDNFEVGECTIIISSLGVPKVQKEVQINVCERTPSDKLEYTLNDDGTSYSVVGLGTETNKCIAIPSSYHGKPVTSIADEAFKNSKITYISVPNSIVSIGKYAFSESELKAITIFDGVKEIGNFAFSGSSLQKIVIPDSVQSIGEYAFVNCYAKSISIGSGLKDIGRHPFSPRDLENITVSENNSRFKAEGNCLIDIYNKELIVGCPTSIIPTDGSVTSIGESAFYNSEIESISIPDSVVAINERAFAYSSLKEIELGNQLKLIADFAFAWCGLKEIEIPDTVTRIGEGAFEGSELEKVKLSKSLERIEEQTFYDCKKLQSIEIPSSVESIGREAFRYCYKLKKVTFASRNVTIGREAFKECYCLTEINMPTSNAIEQETYYSCLDLQEIVIADGILWIKEGAFYYCRNLTSVVIPVSVMAINEKVFSECRNLHSITYKGTMEQWEEITISADFNDGGYIEKIVCSDGTITL